MRKIASFALVKALFILLLVMVLLACATRRNRAIELTAEVYNVHWGDWQKVVEVTSRAISIDPDFAWPYYQRGVAYTELGEYDKAMKDMNTSIDIDPDLGEAYTDRAVIYMHTGEYDKAKLDLDASLSLNPYDMKTLVTFAELYSVKNNVSAACAHMRRAVNNGFNDLSYLQLNKNFSNLLQSECINELFPGNR